MNARQTIFVLVGVMCVGCAMTERHEVGKPVSRLPDVEESVVITKEHPNGPEEVRLVAALEEFPDDGLFSGPVSVDELVAFAVANNPEVKAAQAHARSLGLRVPQVTSLEDPMLSTTAFLDSIETAAGAQDVMLSLTQKFPWFGTLELRGNVACSASQAAWQEAVDVELKVIEEAKTAYYDLFFLDGAIRVHRELERDLESVLEITQAKYRTDAQSTGLETVYQIQTELSELETRVVELEQAKVRSKAKLLAVLHVSPLTPLDIEAKLSTVRLPDTPELLVALVEQCQPQLQARRWDIERDRWAVALAEKDYFPDFNVGVNWYDIDANGLSPVSNGDDAVAIVAGINVPLYRGRIDAAVDEASVRAIRSEQTYEAERANVLRDVVSLHSRALEQDQVLSIVQRDIVPRAESTIDLLSQSYRTNRIDYERIIDAYQDLLRHRIREIQLQTSREKTIAMLERRLGCVAASWNASAFEEVSIVGQVALEPSN